MTAVAVHLPWSGVDLLAARAACGKFQPEVTTFDYDQVTCSACQRTVKFMGRMVEPCDDMTDSQREALRQEFRATLSDTVSLLRQGKPIDAQVRLKWGFDRQVRLAGLEREIREMAAL